jgi:hypothetical protein
VFGAQRLKVLDLCLATPRPRHLVIDLELDPGRRVPARTSRRTCP